MGEDDVENRNGNSLEGLEVLTQFLKESAEEAKERRAQEVEMEVSLSDNIFFIFLGGEEIMTVDSEKHIIQLNLRYEFMPPRLRRLAQDLFVRGYVQVYKD